MPTIKRTETASSENALEGLKFSVLNAPAMLTMYASAAAAGDTVSLSVGDKDILVNAQVNLEVADQVIDTDRDAILIQEVVPAGKLFLRTEISGADLTYMIVLEPIG